MSLWLGPPSIHRRMHALALAEGAGTAALARLARTCSQPDMDAAPDAHRTQLQKPAARRFVETFGKHGSSVLNAHPWQWVGFGSLDHREFTAVEHDPQYVAVGFHGDGRLSRVLAQRA